MISQHLTKHKYIYLYLFTIRASKVYETNFVYTLKDIL